MSGVRDNRAIALAPDGVQVVGIGRPGGLKATAALVGDVAALRPIVATPADLAGTWSAPTAQATAEGLQLGGRLDLAALSWPGPAGQGRRAEGPIAVSMKGLYQGDADRLDLAELVLASRYATLEASGTLSELGGRRLVDLKGTLTPDWKAINGLLAGRVEPGARVSGKPRPAWLSGRWGPARPARCSGRSTARSASTWSRPISTACTSGPRRSSSARARAGWCSTRSTRRSTTAGSTSSPN